MRIDVGMRHALFQLGISKGASDVRQIPLAPCDRRGFVGSSCRDRAGKPAGGPGPGVPSDGRPPTDARNPELSERSFELSLRGRGRSWACSFVPRGREPCSGPVGTLALCSALHRHCPDYSRVGVLPSSSRQRPTALGPAADDSWIRRAVDRGRLGADQPASRAAHRRASARDRLGQRGLLALDRIARSRPPASLRAAPYGSLSAVLLLLFLYRPHFRETAYLVAALGLYALAKGFEETDGAIFALGEIVSGHSLKHLAAAGAVACLVGMLRSRPPKGDLATTLERQPCQCGV